MQQLDKKHYTSSYLSSVSVSEKISEQCVIRIRVKELIAVRATRLATSLVDQTRLGPRTMARLLGVILLTSWFSATCFEEERER